jgi:hypothetical protein
MTYVHEYSPVDTGVRAALLSASPSTNPLHCGEANCIVFEFDHVNAGAALVITADVQVRRANETNWRAAQTATAIGGVDILADKSMSRETTAAEVVALAARWTYVLKDIDADYIRLANITAAGAAAGDTITVRCRVRRG